MIATHLYLLVLSVLTHFDSQITYLVGWAIFSVPFAVLLDRCEKLQEHRALATVEVAGIATLVGWRQTPHVYLGDVPKGLKFPSPDKNTVIRSAGLAVDSTRCAWFGISKLPLG